MLKDHQKMNDSNDLLIDFDLLMSVYKPENKTMLFDEERFVTMLVVKENQVGLERSLTYYQQVCR